VSDEALFGPEPLSAEHDVSSFGCGVSSLDEYLVRRAMHEQSAGKARTYVVSRGQRVAGYFSLAASSLEPADASDRLAKGQGRQPIPVILLGRLAVDACEQRTGLGEALLVQALGKAALAAETIGARAVLVHAVDERARGFYTRYGFEPSPTNPLHLLMLMKDIRRTLSID
jgi:GNAT superfamily N-acetyltransferase